MSQLVNIKGQRFGRLLILRQVGWHLKPSGKRSSVWECQCDCGKVINVRKPYLTSGDTKSCGCLRSEVTGRLKLTHGMSKTSPTYDIWVLMRQRCNNPAASGYEYYGGQGVTVCERWDSFENFLTDMGERPDGLTLDREDPTGNYEPRNCRWATWHTQNNNKRKAA